MLLFQSFGHHSYSIAPWTDHGLGMRVTKPHAQRVSLGQTAVSVHGHRSSAGEGQDYFQSKHFNFNNPNTMGAQQWRSLPKITVRQCLEILSRH